MAAYQWAIVSFIVGFMVGYALRRWLSHKSYVGTILIGHEDEKTLYSLELDDYPETIALKKEVVFRVDTTPENLDRN